MRRSMRSIFSECPPWLQRKLVPPLRLNKRYIVHLAALLFLCSVMWLEFGMARAISFDHTSPTVNEDCRQFSFSPDGNPFPLCPGPFPGGGNCVWWAWEQWHLLGYDLPLNWGNAADWIVDAERFGLPIGTTPRPASIAVFPVADGVWAFGTAGHVAFVTWVSPDQTTFNVTYQDYGDPTPMFTGHGYNVSFINQPRFQNGQMRFIYFPGVINPARFARLAGVDGNGVTQALSANVQATSVQTTGSATSTSRLALGLSPGSYDQEFNADFTGAGRTDLLIYNRQKGSLDVLTFPDHVTQILPNRAFYLNGHNSAYITPVPQQASLGDSITPVNQWGPSLDIRVGDFTGAGRSEILLYNRVTGEIQLLSLTKQLTIQKHVVLHGWGPGWELYAGQFDGRQSDLLMYNRVIVPSPATGVETPSAGPSPIPTTGPTQTPTQSPSPGPSPKPSPSPSPTPKPSPTPSPSPTPTRTPSPTPTLSPTPTHTPSPTPSPSPTPKPNPTATHTPSPTPLPSPTPTRTPSPTPDSDETRTPTPTPTGDTSQSLNDYNGLGGGGGFIQKPAPGGDLSGGATVDTQSLGLSPNIMLVSFKSDFSVNQQQSYTLMHDSWEVYVGHFVNAHQDGLFIYDRIVGEGRIMDFTKNLQVKDFQPVLNLESNWEVHTGDFNGTGRSQLLLYDPGSGAMEFLAFAPNLSLAKRVDDAGVKPGMVLYVGRFGLPTLSIMLYSPTAGSSTFMAFNAAFRVARQQTVASWDQHWQVLIGAFLDRSTCLANHSCVAGDDILALNRKTGKVQRFVFTFGNTYHVYDNRSQSFLRDGVAIAPSLTVVNASTFDMTGTLQTGVTNEELY